jgi:hypothetical protein
VTRRTGSADLPLHGGHVPKWLADRMTRLGAVICEAIVHHYGRDEMLRRLAHPFWFQSFGAVMGMDWHSSGITTSVIGALKRGLAPLAGELGVHVCGGRGRHSRQTPLELVAIGDRLGFDGAALARASRLVAKVDSAAVQDGFDLYLHGFFVTDEGRWTVVQQGMNGERGQARRYHWLSEGLNSFVEAPHAAIDGPDQGEIVNLTDRRADAARRVQVDMLQSRGLTKSPANSPISRLGRSDPSRQFLRRNRSCRISSCPLITRCARATCTRAGCRVISRRRRPVGRSTSPNCCSFPASGRAPCAHWRWSRRSCTVRPIVSATPRDFPSRTAARTGIRSRCRSTSMIKRSRC